jgi:hypothetical protein
MQYSELTKSQQIQLLTNRIQGWEADHYGHEINLAAGTAAGDESTIKASTEALAVLEASITSARGMLATLRPEEE